MDLKKELDKEAKESLIDSLIHMRKEIDTWRREFTEDSFLGTFKFIPERDKRRLEAYFMSIPSSSFSTPWKEWGNCISALLQHKEDSNEN